MNPKPLVPGTKLLIAMRPDGLPTPCACCIARLRTDPTIAFYAGELIERTPDRLHFRLALPTGDTIEAALGLGPDTVVIILDPHHAVCAECRELTPCRHHRAEHAVKSFSHQLDRAEAARRATDQRLR